MRRFGFPDGCEEGHSAGQPAPREDTASLATRQLHVQAEPGVRGPGTRCCSLSWAWEERSGREGGSGPQADGSGSQKVTRGLLYEPGEKPSAKRGSPCRERR